MTKYYGQDKETDRAVETLIQREVLACQTSLVNRLLGLEIPGGTLADDFSYDEIENAYPDPSDWDIDEYREYCEEHGIDIIALLAPEDLDELDELQNCVVENAEPAEIFEWWLITTWAAGKLREQHEPILEVGNDIWWGRTCTGQSIALDPTWYDIQAGLCMTTPTQDATAQHTPGKWAREEGQVQICAPEWDGQKIVVAEVVPRLLRHHENGQKASEEAAANAAFIVLACNAHDELVAACTEVVDLYNREPKVFHLNEYIYNLAKAAILKATP